MTETIRLFSLQIVLIAVVLVLHTYLGLHIIRRTLIFSDMVLTSGRVRFLVGVGLGFDYGVSG